jgi:hypothetical protein
MPVILDTFPATLECSTLIFRALKPSWAPEGGISSQAFILLQKQGIWETGLSVSNNLGNALKVFERTKAVASLHIGKIRDLSEGLGLDLDVIPDSEPNPKFDPDNITHGEIIGMPPPDTIENALIAERFATALVELIKNRPFAWERPPA